MTFFNTTYCHPLSSNSPYHGLSLCSLVLLAPLSSKMAIAFGGDVNMKLYLSIFFAYEASSFRSHNSPIGTLNCIRKYKCSAVYAPSFLLRLIVSLGPCTVCCSATITITKQKTNRNQKATYPDSVQNHSSHQDEQRHRLKSNHIPGNSRKPLIPRPARRLLRPKDPGQSPPR